MIKLAEWARIRWRPSLAQVVTAAFWSIAVLPAATLPLTDPDTWWHIRAGQEVMRNGAIPSVDTWSIAGAGRSWTSQDWASNVMMAAVYDLGAWGPVALSIVYGVFAIGAVAMLWDGIRVRLPTVGWMARLTWLLLGLVLAAPVLGVRVQVVDLFFSAAVVNVLWRYLAYRRRRLLALLPLIAITWVNLHAGFPLLFLVGGAVITGEAVDRALGRRPDGEPLRWSDLTWLVVALLVAAASLVVNPNGAAMYRYPFDTLGIGALASFVGEWQPARLDVPAGQLLAVFVVVGLSPTLLIGRQRLRTGDGLILVGLAFMAVTAVRFLLVAGPLGSAIACVTLAPVVSRTTLGVAFGRVLGRLARRPGGAATRVMLLATIGIGLGLTLVRVGPPAQMSAVAEIYPVRAVDWLAENRPGERIFNRYEWGGYLGLRLPERPVFIDGRADVYGDEILREYVATISATEDPQATFDRYAIDHILYPPDTTLGRWLQASNAWEPIYSDAIAWVWVSR